MKYQWWIILVAINFHNVVSAAAQSNLIRISEAAGRLSIGQSQDECRAMVNLVEVRSDKFLSTYPFSDILSFLSASNIIVWTDGQIGLLGHPNYMIAVFSPPPKRELLDLLRMSNGRKTPLLSGIYVKSLKSLHSGMNILDMYHSVGIDRCDYFIGEDGSWRVRFSYPGLGHSTYIIEANAATGNILSVVDQGI